MVTAHGFKTVKYFGSIEDVENAGIKESIRNYESSGI